VYKCKMNFLTSRVLVGEKKGGSASVSFKYACHDLAACW
jgi:hypothetical protein